MTFTEQFLQEAGEILGRLDHGEIERVVEILAATRQQGGRLFILGVGGSAANASHAVNDFRKIAGIEAYCPTDNVSELTARVNDEGWETVFVEWLKVRRDEIGLAPLAKMLGADATNLGKVIEGKRKPSNAVLTKITALRAQSI